MPPALLRFHSANEETAFTNQIINGGALRGNVAGHAAIGQAPGPAEKAVETLLVLQLAHGQPPDHCQIAYDCYYREAMATAVSTGWVRQDWQTDQKILRLAASMR